MTKNQNIIYWAIGIAIFLLVVTQLPISPWFAVVTKVTCTEGVESHWDFNGNVLDSKGINNADAKNVTYIPGKLGQAIEFDGSDTTPPVDTFRFTYVDMPSVASGYIVMWIKNYSDGDVDYNFIADLNGTNYVNGMLDDTKQVIPLEAAFGSLFNGSVDEVAIFSSLSVSDMLILYNEGNAREVCYTTSFEENVTCQDYALAQTTDSGTGCLNYSGIFFPDCTYSLESESGFYIVSNMCQKRTECKDILSADYSSLTLCQAELTDVTEEKETITAPDTAIQTDTTTFGIIKDKLSKKIFEIAEFEVTLLHLLILLALVILTLWFMGFLGKR